MSSELQITFRGMLPSEELRDVVQQKFDKTAHLFASCACCRVVLDSNVAGHRKGAPVSAQIALYGTGQGVRIAVEARHVDPATAVRKAFERIQRHASA